MNWINERTGARTYIDMPVVWTLLFGCFYLAYKGAWRTFVIHLLVAVCTVGLGWVLLMPFIAPALIRSELRSAGYLPEDELVHTSHVSPANVPMLKARMREQQEPGAIECPTCNNRFLHYGESDRAVCPTCGVALDIVA